MNRRGLLALVHCARKDLALSEDTYRAVLEQVAGASSARDLDDRQLGKVVDHFKRLGWKPKNQAAQRPSDNPQARKIWALWGDLCKRKGLVRTPTRAALRAFCKRLTGVSDPEWLTPEQANTVIENLKTWRARGGSA
jgi:phage gp16-like protein